MRLIGLIRPNKSHSRCPQELSEEKNMRPKNIFTLLLLSLVCFGITAMAQENPFLGKWDITGVGQHSNYVYWLEVKEEDGKLTGSFLNRSGSVLPLEEIKIEGGDLIFSPKAPRADSPKATHRAKVEDGRLLGMMTAGDQEVAWIGVRPPKWGGDFNANTRSKRRATAASTCAGVTSCRCWMTPVNRPTFTATWRSTAESSRRSTPASRPASGRQWKRPSSAIA